MPDPKVLYVTHDTSVYTTYVKLDNMNSTEATDSRLGPFCVDLDADGNPTGTEILNKAYNLTVGELRNFWDQYPAIAPQVTAALIKHAYVEDGDDVTNA